MNKANINDAVAIRPGDYYEDYMGHPCVCVYSSLQEDDLMGISLVDGSFPRSASFVHNHLVKISLVEAIQRKFEMIRDEEASGKVPTFSSRTRMMDAIESHLQKWANGANLSVNAQDSYPNAESNP